MIEQLYMFALGLWTIGYGALLHISYQRKLKPHALWKKLFGFLTPNEWFLAFFGMILILVELLPNLMFLSFYVGATSAFLSFETVIMSHDQT